jgi:hypothetical protein
MQYLGDKGGRGRFRSSLRSLAATTALAIGAAISLPAISFADEDGVSFWIPGFFGSLAAIQQHPGWSFTAVNYYTPVSASGAVAVAREITIGRFNPTVNVNPNVSSTEAEIATITGHSLKDVRSILDAHYLHRDPALAESAIRKLEKRTKTPNYLPTAPTESGSVPDK